MQRQLAGSRLQAGRALMARRTSWPRLTWPWLFGRVRFLFDGNRLRDNQTPDKLEMEDDDVIEAILFACGDIGIFGEHRGGCGVELLQDGEALQHASAADAKRIMLELGPTARAGDTGEGLVMGDKTVVLDAGGRAALMGLVDKLRVEEDPRVDTSHGAHDEQVDISAQELAALVGGAEAERLARLYGSRADRITIRRVEAAGERAGRSRRHPLVPSARPCPCVCAVPALRRAGRGSGPAQCHRFPHR
jgi:hypothetical protein